MKPLTLAVVLAALASTAIVSFSFFPGYAELRGGAGTDSRAAGAAANLMQANPPSVSEVAPRLGQSSIMEKNQPKLLLSEISIEDVEVMAASMSQAAIQDLYSIATARTSSSLEARASAIMVLGAEWEGKFTDLASLLRTADPKIARAALVAATSLADKGKRDYILGEILQISRSDRPSDVHIQAYESVYTLADSATASQYIDQLAQHFLLPDVVSHACAVFNVEPKRNDEKPNICTVPR